MARRFPGYVHTRVWQMPDGLGVEYRCRIEEEDELTTVDVHMLPLNATDAVLGADVLHALQNVQVRSWEQLDPALARMEKEFPDYDELWQRHHSVYLSFDPKDEAHLNLDARAAKLNKPNRTRIASDSSKVAVGAAGRKLLAQLGPAAPARAAAKKTAQKSVARKKKS